jgi:hypothetical protein
MEVVLAGLEVVLADQEEVLAEATSVAMGVISICRRVIANNCSLMWAILPKYNIYRDVFNHQGPLSLMDFYPKYNPESPVLFPSYIKLSHLHIHESYLTMMIRIILYILHIYIYTDIYEWIYVFIRNICLYTYIILYNFITVYQIYTCIFH